MTSATVDFEVHPRLDSASVRALVHPERTLWTPIELRLLTSVTAGALAAPLSEVARFVPERRWWARLALTWGVELWLLSWLPGQGTRPHDHGGAAGSFTVLTGTLSETYRYPGKQIRHAQRATGATIGFGAGHAHEVRNRGVVPALSVHAYSPPLVPTRNYSSLHHIPDRIPPLPARPRSFAELRAQAEDES
ncbi:MAG TPA: cysteine dioxygenase family protein [Amycolatopsis sp.]|nr:cysteine dioxygenase family protein [Amycolatopsis sp.]